MTTRLLFVVLILTLGTLIRSACTPSNNPAVATLTAPINTSNIITFDNIGLYDRAAGCGWFDWADGPRSVSDQVDQNITLIGAEKNRLNGAYLCGGNTDLLNGITWNGTAFWNNSTSEKPGFYLFVDSAGHSTLQFSPPISAFVMRANNPSNPPDASYITIYDKDGQVQQCQDIPYIPGTNTYAYVGFSSTVPIAAIRFDTPNGQAVADSIQYTTCDSGFAFNITNCVDVDECQNDPCGEHATCENTIGSYSCSCNDGYEINNATCIDIDECTTLSPCSSFANCTNTDGSFTCSCNTGYTGDGRGQNGCTAVQSPNDNTPSTGPSSVVSTASFTTIINVITLLLAALLV